MTSTSEPSAGYASTVSAVALASFLLPLAITAPSSELPDIARSLQAGAVGTQWLVNAYAIAFAVTVLPAGSMADRIGRRRVLRSGTVLFGFTSALIAAAPNIAVADVLRVPEAAGAAGILASGAAMLSHAAPGARRARAFGVLGTSFGSGLALGPVIAGALVPLSWRAPLGAIAIMAFAAGALGGRSAESRNLTAAPIDGPGIALFTAALLALSVALVQAPTWGWFTTPTLGLTAFALLLLIGFSVVEIRRRAPMFDVRLFTRPAFVAVTCQPLTVTFGFVILIVYLPPFVERAAGMSVLGASAVLLPLTVPVIVIPLAASQLLKVLGVRGTLVAASLLIAVGSLLLVRISPEPSFREMIPGLLVFGFGVGTAFSVMDNAAVGAVPVDQAGTASGMFNTIRLTTEAIAIAAGGAILTSLTADRLGTSSRHLAAEAVQGRVGGPILSPAVAGSFRVVVVGLAVMALIGAIATFAALRSPARSGVARDSLGRSG